MHVLQSLNSMTLDCMDHFYELVETALRSLTAVVALRHFKIDKS